MNKIDGEKIIERYIVWLRDNIHLKNIKDDIIAIDSPFFDRHNDSFRIYIKKVKEDIYYLTDDGFVFYDLETSGFSMTETKRKIFQVFINNQAVKFNEKTQELYVESDWENLPQRKNDLLQAMINIGDMFLCALPYVKSLFFEEVTKFFKSKEIKAIPDVYIEGKGFKEKVDFIIPQSEKKPEKLIKLVNNPSRGFYKNFLFLFLDISKGNTIHAKSNQILLINNTEKSVSPMDLKAIQSYSVEPILWSEREDKLEILG